MANALGLAVCALAIVVVVLGFTRGGHTAARVAVHDDRLEITPIGLAKLWSLKRSVTIPAPSVRDVHTFDGELPSAARFGGRVLAGRYRAARIRSFLVVGRSRPVVVIECPGAVYDRVVFSTPDPDGAVAAITAVMASPLP